MDDLEDDINELSSISSSSPGSVSQNLLGGTSDISYIGQEDDESQILSSRSASLVPTPTPQTKRKLTFLNIMDCSGDPGFAWVGSGWVCHPLGGGLGQVSDFTTQLDPLPGLLGRSVQASYCTGVG